MILVVPAHIQDKLLNLRSIEVPHTLPLVLDRLALLSLGEGKSHVAVVGPLGSERPPEYYGVHGEEAMWGISTCCEYDVVGQTYTAPVRPTLRNMTPYCAG